MIRTVVLPYGRAASSAARCSASAARSARRSRSRCCCRRCPRSPIKILQNGGATVSGFIADRAGGDAFTVSGLMAAGLVLFVITLGTNMIASVVVARSRSGAGVEL